MKEKQNNKKTRLGKKAIFILAGAVVVLAAIIVAIVCTAGDEKEQEKPTMKIQTPYIELVLPLELENLVISEESTYNNTYTRAFYMSYNGEEVPLWRVDFGDAKAGDWVGILRTEEGDIPVTMLGFVLSDEELNALGSEGSRKYGECMQAYSFMMDGIMADSRFTAQRPLAVGENREVKLTYWNVTLPGKMSVQEIDRNGSYEAVFSGEVAGEMVLLYRVYIGEEQGGSRLGFFEINGVKKPIFIESYALGDRESWSEDDYATVYRMMDTINDVIKQITSGKGYSEFDVG